MVDIPVSLLLTGAATVLLLLRKSPLGFAAIYYIYFSFGPALLYYTGGEIYHGIVVDWIPKALWGFALGILGWAIADLIWRLRAAAIQARREDDAYFGAPAASSAAATGGPSGAGASGAGAAGGAPAWSSWTYNLLAVLGSAYGVAVGASVILRGATSNKLEAVLAAGPFHYRYLLIMSLVLCWSIASWKSGKAARRLALVMWLGFVFYCLATSERDFLLVAFAIGIHLGVNRRGWRTILGFVVVGLVALLAGTALFEIRAGRGAGLSLASVLGQGSTLFIDTFMYDWIAKGNVYPTDSWWSALMRQYPTEDGPLSQWFVGAFLGNPEAEAAYGFSLSAEAYMNAGTLGILGLFVLLGLIQLWLSEKGKRSGLWSGMSIAFMYQILYSLRGESYALITAILAIIGLAVLIRLGQNPPPPEEEREDVPLSGKWRSDPV